MSEVTITNNTESSHYEAVLDGEVVGFAEYRQHGDVVEFPHTVVEKAHSGQGIAGRLANVALDDAREAGHQVVPTCSFFASWIRRHPEYQELVAEEGSWLPRRADGAERN